MTTTPTPTPRIALAFNREYSTAQMRLLAVYNEGIDLETELTAAQAERDALKVENAADRYDLKQYHAMCDRIWEALGSDRHVGHPDLCDVRLIKKLTRLRAIADELAALLGKIAKQRPSRPDYWNTCRQCEDNSGDAEELLAHYRAAFPAAATHDSP